MYFSITYFLMKILNPAFNYVLQQFEMAEENHRKYMKITLEKRKKVVELIDQGKTAVYTAKKLGLNASTVKAIYKKFCQEGTFFETKQEKLKRQIIEKILHQNQQRPQYQISNEFPLIPFPNPCLYMPSYAFCSYSNVNHNPIYPVYPPS